MSDRAYANVQVQQKTLSEWSSTNSLLQRSCACGQHTLAGGECEECRKKREGMVHRSAIGLSSTDGVPPIVHEVLRSPGQPLDAGTRAFMEPRFGHDFSQVRVHADAGAAESARSVDALAYTVGRHIVFGERQYSPNSMAGRQLLAHELTHVIQQDDNAHAQRQNATTGPMQDANEREAQRVALLIGASGDAGRVDSPGTVPILQRQPAPPEDDPQKKPGKKEATPQPPPQKIPAPEARQEPQALDPPDGLQFIQKKVPNLGPDSIAGGWTFHEPPRSYPYFEQGDPIQKGGQWVAQVKQVTPRPPTIQSYYAAAGKRTHTIATGGPGGAKYYEITPDDAKLLQKGEQEHIDDHLWAYTHTQKVIEEAINETASSSGELVGENIKKATEAAQAAFLSRLPPELRPLDLTKNQQIQKWWSPATGIYSKLDRATKERDVKGWHTVSAHFDSGRGHYVLATKKMEIGKHPSEAFMKSEYEKLTSEKKK